MIVNSEIEAYCVNHSSAMSEQLAEIETYTQAHIPQSHMLSGALQGNLLKLLCQLTQAKNILEIGTFTGFSSIAMAEGLSDEGKIYTIEKDEKLVQRLK